MLMAVTTVLAALVALQWGYNPALVAAVNGFFLIIDLIFVAANATKLLEGGWFPLLLAGVVAFLMLTWRTGYRLLEQQRSRLRQREDEFLPWVLESRPIRLPGAAAIFTAATSGIPLATRLGMLLDIAATPLPSATDETQILSVPIELRRSGREIKMLIEGTDPFATAKPDTRLIKLEGYGDDQYSALFYFPDEPFVLRTDNDDTRFEAKCVTAERMSFLGGRFDDLPVFDGLRQLAFL
jgi:hypothetical protein